MLYEGLSPSFPLKIGNIDTGCGLIMICSQVAMKHEGFVDPRRVKMISHQPIGLEMPNLLIVIVALIC